MKALPAQQAAEESRVALDEIVRNGARRTLAEALEATIETFLSPGPCLRRQKNLDELVPRLYLRGISTGDFSEALEALVGPDARELRANGVTRLASTRQQAYIDWNQRALSSRSYVYFRDVGVDSNVRLEEAS